jgi:hypothetical protein
MGRPGNFYWINPSNLRIATARQADLLCKSSPLTKGSMKQSPFSRGNKRGFLLPVVISTEVEKSPTCSSEAGGILQRLV